MCGSEKSCLYGVGSSFTMGCLMKFSSDAYIVVYESRELYFAVHNSFILWKMLISLSLDVQF